MRQQLVVEEVLATSVKTSSGVTAITFSCKAANSMEYWVDVTAVSGTNPSMNILVEHSIVDNRDVVAADFVEIGQIPNITATGIFTLSLNRIDDPIGSSYRVSFQISGTTPSFTFNIRSGKKEF